MQIGRRAKHRPKSLQALFFRHFTILSFVFSVVLSVTVAHPCPIDNPHPGKWEGRQGIDRRSVEAPTPLRASRSVTAATIAQPSSRQLALSFGIFWD